VCCRVINTAVNVIDCLTNDTYVAGIMPASEASREKVKCSRCPVMTSRRYMARHRRNYHDDSASVCDEPRTQPSLVSRAESSTGTSGALSRSSSRDTVHSAGASTHCSSMHDGTSSSSLLSQVALAVLDQHHCYTEEGL